MLEIRTHFLEQINLINEKIKNINDARYKVSPQFSLEPLRNLSNIRRGIINSIKHAKLSAYLTLIWTIILPHEITTNSDAPSFDK